MPGDSIKFKKKKRRKEERKKGRKEEKQAIEAGPQVIHILKLLDMDFNIAGLYVQENR